MPGAHAALPDLRGHRGGAAPVELDEVSRCLFREHFPEEVRGREQLTGLVQVAGDDGVPVRPGHGELPHAHPRPVRQPGTGVHDAACAQPAAVADHRAVEHHDLGRDVDGSAQGAACQRGLRADQAVVPDSHRVRRALVPAGGPDDRAGHDGHAGAQLDRGAGADDEGSVVDHRGGTDAHIAYEHGR